MAGIGQQSVRVTPLQMAQVAATVANDGNQMQPYLVKRTLDDKLSVISTTSPKVARSPISSTVAGQLKTMMIQVVASGTGTSAQVDGMDVAGKTGTAETGSDGGPVTWFIGYAGPSGQAPTIAIAAYSMAAIRPLTRVLAVVKLPLSQPLSLRQRSND